MARIKAPAAGSTEEAQVRVRRSYFDCRYGQLQVRTGFPSSGGFDEQTTLLCFHQAQLSSRVFRSFLPEIARDRSVYAPDTPGCGESDPPPARPSIADIAAAMGDFIDTMRFRQVDLLGYQAGAWIAAELAAARPEQIRRLILVSLPVSGGQDRRDSIAAEQAAPFTEDGSHLLRAWQRKLAARGPGMTLEMCAEEFADQLRNAADASLSSASVHEYPALQRLPLLRQPTLMLRPRDQFWDASLQARQLIRGLQMIDLPDHGAGLFSVAPELVARHAREFLNARP